MKRFGILLAIVVAVALLVTSGHSQPRVDSPPVPPPIFYVIGPNAANRTGGPGRYLCDGTADNVQIQAAIDAAEAMGAPSGEDAGWYGPTIILSADEYDIAATIDVGYDSNGDPYGNAGVTIKAEGRGAWLKWSGGETAAAWIMRYCPGDAETAQHGGLHNLIFHGDDKANGLYVQSAAYRGEMSNLSFHECKGFTLYAARSHEGTWRNLLMQNSNGGGAVAFMTAHGTKVESIDMLTCLSTTLPRHRRYKYDNRSGTFEPFEYVQTAGGKVGFILKQDSDELWVAMEYGSTGDTDFADNEEVVGQTSKATGDIVDAAGETYDLSAGILFYGGSMARLEHVIIQGNEFSEEDGDPDSPMILIRSCSGMEINQLYTEGIAWRSAKQANTFIAAYDSYASIFRNLSFTPADPTLMTTGSVSGTTVTVASSTFTSRLLDNDYIYIWDGVGGVADQECRVNEATPSGLTFDIDQNLGTDAELYVSAVTASTANAAERYMPDIGIYLFNCDYTTVENVAFRGLRTAAVSIAWNSEGVTVRNLRDTWAYHSTLYETNWNSYPHPPVHVADAGVRTQILGAQPIDPTGLDYTGNPDAVQVFEETAGIVRKTTLLLHDKQMSIDGSAIGFGTEKIYDFPTGNILVLGVVVNAEIDTTDQYDSGMTISDTADGDFSCGTTGTSDSTLDTTDVDLCPKTTIAQLVSGEGPLDGVLGANVQFNGTATAKDLYLSVLIDDADISGNTTIALQGTVIFHWVPLGDY